MGRKGHAPRLKLLPRLQSREEDPTRKRKGLSPQPSVCYKSRRQNKGDPVQPTRSSIVRLRRTFSWGQLLLPNLKHFDRRRCKHSPRVCQELACTLRPAGKSCECEGCSKRRSQETSREEEERTDRDKEIEVWREGCCRKKLYRELGAMELNRLELASSGRMFSASFVSKHTNKSPRLHPQGLRGSLRTSSMAVCQVMTGPACARLPLPTSTHWWTSALWYAPRSSYSAPWPFQRIRMEVASKEQHVEWATFRLFFEILAPGAAKLCDHKVGYTSRSADYVYDGPSSFTNHQRTAYIILKSPSVRGCESRCERGRNVHHLLTVLRQSRLMARTLPTESYRLRCGS